MKSERPLLSARRVKFYTRSFSLELYEQAKHLFEGAGYPCVRLTDQTADGYFFTMLADTDCDVAINVDEDAYIEDLEAVLDLADNSCSLIASSISSRSGSRISSGIVS